MNIPPGFTAAYGQILPVSPVYRCNQHASDHKLLRDSLKREKKMQSKCALECTNPDRFRRSMRTYLKSHGCFIAGMWHANKKLPVIRRSSVGSIIETAEKYQGLKCLDEEVTVRIEQKASGKGTRPIHDFRIAARGAQRMANTLIKLTYTPRAWQHAKLSFGKKIELAIAYIESGYRHVAELDIKGHFPSFESKKLENHLPLPKEATRQIICAQSAKRVDPSGQSLLSHNIDLICPGIPQGGKASSEVASESVSHLKMLNVKDVILINHADNFFLFAMAPKPLEFALKALKSAIANLPGGSFDAEIVQVTNAQNGFRMLGCWLHLESETVCAQPTEQNQQNFWGRYKVLKQRIESTLIAAEKESSAILRLQGVQDFLRLESLFLGWVTAFEFCGDIIELICDDIEDEIAALVFNFNISSIDRKLANDGSVQSNVDFYGH